MGYADLQDAIDAVADGGTITVMKDGLGTVTIQGSKTFTLVKGEDVDTLPTLVAASGYRLTAPAAPPPTRSAWTAAATATSLSPPRVPPRAIL